MISLEQEIMRLERLEKSDKTYLRSLESYQGASVAVKEDIIVAIADTGKRLKKLRKV